MKNKPELEKQISTLEADHIEQIRGLIKAAKWQGEPCPNPEKGWIRDSRDNRLTRLGNRNAYGKIIKAHNNEIDVVIAPAISALVEENQKQAAQIKVLRDILHDVRDHIDGEIDVVDGSYGEPAPNKAMVLDQNIVEALKQTEEHDG